MRGVLMHLMQTGSIGEDERVSEQHDKAEIRQGSYCCGLRDSIQKRNFTRDEWIECSRLQVKTKKKAKGSGWPRWLNRMCIGE